MLAAIGLHEFYAMALPGRSGEGLAAILLGTALAAAVQFCPHLPALLGTLVLIVLLLALLFLFRYRDIATVGGDLALALFGILYVPLLLSHAGLLRHFEHGREWVALVLLVVMAGDSLAYFCGMSFGRHRLYPAISPKKSVEGAVGGLAGGLLGALAARAWLLPVLGPVDVLAIGVGVGAASQLGDLVESMLKRSCGVKDSGALFPGHGGLLDRLDSLLFAFPLTYYYVLWCMRP